MAADMKQVRDWSHPSVKAFAEKGDPLQAIVSEARSLVFRAMETGWTGPPFDPLSLAKILGIQLVPREDIVDARTVPISAKRVQIEYNPTRPRGRLRFSVAHEIAHTLFPDCSNTTRNRLSKHEMSGDDWQLEMLCNVAAAEIVMPIGSFTALKDEPLSIDAIMARRREFDVSTEALLLRIINLTEEPCALFAASRSDTDGRYRVDYLIPSAKWQLHFRNGTHLPSPTSVAECTAIGFTAKSDESWPNPIGQVHVECVGVPPYPDRVYPRVVGFITPHTKTVNELPSINYIKGDATDPRGEGRAIIAHVINDRAHSWGGGFASALRKRWPIVHDEFQAWVARDKNNLKLGNCHIAKASSQVSVFSAVAQHGYGPSPTPRLRYTALMKCLDSLGSLANEQGAEVHAPRIGCGEAGGKWTVVEELIEELLTRRGLRVTIYDLPGADTARHQDVDTLFSSIRRVDSA